MLDLNFFGTISLTNSLLPYMMRERSGCIVIVSSIAGKIGKEKMSAFLDLLFHAGVPCSTGYSASKHALQVFGAKDENFIHYYHHCRDILTD